MAAYQGLDFVDNFFDGIAANVGFPSDQLKFLSCIFASFPLCFFMKYLPNIPAVKHLYSIFWSMFFSFLCFGYNGILHTIGSALVSYLMMKYLPHGTAHKAVFIWMLGYMSVSHIYRMWTDYMGWSMDFTTAQMLLTQKCTSMAFNYFDGRQPAGKTAEEHQKRAISVLPGLLEYFGFVFFLPSYMAGPSCEIVEYQRYISKQMFDDPVLRGKFPSSLRAVGWCILRAAALVPFMLIQPMFPISYFRTEKFLHHTSFFERLWRMYVHATLARVKYYFAWFLSEGLYDACGLGYQYDAKTKTINWDRFQNMKFFKVELAPNVRSITQNWNIRTAEWLRFYVYDRVVPAGSRQVPLYATMAVYAVSAFWHGFYPGYYMFFFLTGVYTEVAKDVRRQIRPLFVDDKNPNPNMQMIYDVITTLTTTIFLNYGGLLFLLLDFMDGVRMCSGLYWFGHIGGIAAMAFFQSGVSRMILPRAPSAVVKKTA